MEIQPPRHKSLPKVSLNLSHLNFAICLIFRHCKSIDRSMKKLKSVSFIYSHRPQKHGKSSEKPLKYILKNMVTDISGVSNFFVLSKKPISPPTAKASKPQMTEVAFRTRAHFQSYLFHLQLAPHNRG